MKFHWGKCPAQEIQKEYETYLDTSLKIRNETLLLLEAEKKYSSHLLKQNDELAKKIAHLEEVISDYNKVTLLQEQPIYIEASTIPEESKRKRKSV